MSPTAERTRARLVEAAAELFDERGFAGVTLRDVAGAAGVSTRTAARHFPDIAALFGEVVAARARSSVADRMAQQAREPAVPPMGVLLWAAREVFAAPERTWGPLELEAFAAARRDEGVAALVRARLAERWSVMDAVAQQMRAGGFVDDRLTNDALTHFALALSVGLAMVDPVVPVEVDEREWSEMMARLLVSIGPAALGRGRPVHDESLWRVRVDVPDRVGAIEQLARVLTALDAFVITTSTPGSDAEGWRTLDLLLTCPASLEEGQLRDAVGAVGVHTYVRAGSDDDRVDLATRVLDGVAQIMQSPRSAPERVAQLVEADSFEFTDATSGDDDAADVLRLQWLPTRHVVLRRSWAPFIKAEQRRASAAMRLAATLASSFGDAEALGWVEPMRGGGQAWMRLARPEDSEAVTAMHERCGERTIHQRYFRNITEWRELTMRRLSGGHRGASIVVMAEDGSIVGLGNVFPLDDDAAEVALILEDAYQGRGLGGRLLDHLLDLAQLQGYDRVVASVLAENRGMIALLDRTGLAWERRVESGVTEFSAPLPQP